MHRLLLVLSLLSSLALSGESHAQSRPSSKSAISHARDSVHTLILRDADGVPVAHDHFRASAILSNGSVLFADLHDHQVFLFDTLGRFVAKAGRKGAGPGEFEQRSRLLRLRGDSVGVYDESLRRLSVFDGKLKFVRSQTVPSPAGARSMPSVIGQFADGSIVLLSRPFPDMTVPDGVRNVSSTLFVSSPAGALRRMELPAASRLHVRMGATVTSMAAPATSTRAVAVCERGMVAIADKQVAVYDTAFRLVSTPASRAHAETLSTSARDAFLKVYTTDQPEYAAKYRAAIAAANPHPLIRHARTVISSDGLIWFALGGRLDGRFVRTTPQGTVVDTVLAPYWVLQANRRMAIASGPFEPDEDAPAAIVRQRVAPRTTAASPVSSLGNCNSVVEY